MRVNMDSSIATDPRFRLLATDLGCSMNEVVGALFFCWLACYERRSERLSAREADACCGIPGFAKATAIVGLSDIDSESDEVEFHGVTERIEFLRKQAKRGAKGGRKGKGKPKHRRQIANAKQNQSEATAKSPALTLTPALTPARFDLSLVYDLYPVHKGKKRGLDKLKRLVKTQEQYDTILAAVRKMHDAWQGRDTQYCPHFSTFVSQERWGEDLPLPDGGRPQTRINFRQEVPDL